LPDGTAQRAPKALPATFLALNLSAVKYGVQELHRLKTSFDKAAIM
jgi:hypothetical protein